MSHNFYKANLKLKTPPFFLIKSPTQFFLLHLNSVWCSQFHSDDQLVCSSHMSLSCFYDLWIHKMVPASNCIPINLYVLYDLRLDLYLTLTIASYKSNELVERGNIRAFQILRRTLPKTVIQWILKSLLFALNY